MLVVEEDRAGVSYSAPDLRAIRSLADVRDLISAAKDGSYAETKLQISAINTVARTLGCAPCDLPADPAALRVELAKISPAMAGLTHGSWASVRSRVRKALHRANIAVMASKRTTPLPPQWAALYDRLGTHQKKRLGRFISIMAEHGVAPAEVSDTNIDQFRSYLRSCSLRARPLASVKTTVKGWNAAVDTVSGWPPQRLAKIETGRVGYVLPLEEFLPEFQQSLLEFVDFLADPPEDDNAPFRPLRPSTLIQRAFGLRQIASALIHKGVPLADLTNIKELTRREHIDEVCDFFTERSGRQDCVQLTGLLSMLRAIARYHVRDTALGDWIGRRARRLQAQSGRRKGMTEKNRRRLSLFRDARLVRDLLLLPYRLLKRAEAGNLAPEAAARLVRAAVAIEIELVCPIRLQNLSELNADTDFVRGRSGKRSPVHLYIPGKRTKNGEDIEFEIPRQTWALIDLYLSKHRALLIDPQHRATASRFLFPRPDGQPQMGRLLATSLCKMLRRELGIEFNVHLFRHLSCFIYLRANPGQVDVMRRVLGHTDSATTLRFYAYIEQSDAFRMFDQHILQIREEALRPGRVNPSSGRKAGRR